MRESRHEPSCVGQLTQACVHPGVGERQPLDPQRSLLGHGRGGVGEATDGGRPLVPSAVAPYHGISFGPKDLNRNSRYIFVTMADIDCERKDGRIIGICMYLPGYGRISSRGNGSSGRSPRKASPSRPP